MKVEVTDKVSGQKLSVDPAHVKILEPLKDGGSHIVFGADQGRALVEEYEQLKPYFDVVSVSAAGLKMAMKFKK